MINITLLHYELGNAGLPAVGVSSEGKIDYSRALTPSEQVIADTIVANHDPNGLLPWEQDESDATIAKVSFRNLPNYATWTPQEAQDNITNAVLNGKTLAQINAEIDALANTVAGMKVGLKTLAAAIIDLRGVLAVIGKMIVLLRIVAVRKN